MTTIGTEEIFRTAGPTSLINEDGQSLSVLSSYPTWRGLALHSLATAAIFVCVSCERTQESTMVAVPEHRGGLVCPNCYACAQHLRPPSSETG